MKKGSSKYQKQINEVMEGKQSTSPLASEMRI